MLLALAHFLIPPHNQMMDLLKQWNQFSVLPFGDKIFSKVVGLKIPYTGSISAHVKQLRPAYAEVILPDSRKVRNHLQCIHAIALMNLGEFSTGLALHASLPENFRAILTHLEIDYFKKARGDISSIVTLNDSQKIFTDAATFKIPFSLKDSKSEIVSGGCAHWKIGIYQPRK